MHETATLHFDLSHLAPDQPFTLHVGSSSYDLAPHTRQTLTRARRSNSALRLLRDDRVTHFTGPVRLPANAPVLLRVTGLKRRADEPLDRLVLVSLYLPRRVRLAGAARRRQPGRPVRLPPKFTARAVADTSGLPPDIELIGDIGDINTAEDAAAALVFHHTELLTTQAEPADDIINNIIVWARGLDALAQSILSQSKVHEDDPSKPNWVNSMPGKDWQTGGSSNPIYAWSDATLADLRLPLSDALQQSKNDPTLQNQCWTVQPGTTQVPMATAPAGLVRDTEATYTVKDLTAQSGVDHSFGYVPATSTATLSLKNYYLRWLQICVDQYGPGGEKIGPTQTLGQQSPVDTIMSVPLPPDWSAYSFTFGEDASRATVSYGGLGQAPFSWDYDGGGIIWTAVFNYAVPLIFIALGVAFDQGGSSWSDLTKSVVAKATNFVEAAAEGPVGDAVSGSFAMTDVLLAVTNCAGSMLTSLLTSSEQLNAYIMAAAGEGAAEKASPFLGWASLAVGAAADTSSLIQTSAEVASSPATMSVDIERTLDVAVTVNPDPGHQNQWPATATHYTITVTYDDGTARVYDGQLNPTTQQGPIEQTFTALPAGGTISVLACFYSGTGWLAGQGSAGPVPAQPSQGSTLTIPAFAIIENLVPLSAATTYTLKEKLAFQSSSRVWAAPPAAAPPTATVSALDGSNVGNNLGQLGQLTLNEQQSALGYLWKASGQGIPLVGTSEPYTGQEFTFQAISDGADPQSGLKFTEYGYLAQPCLAFSPATMPSPPAAGFLLEPDPATDVMWLRALSLTSGQPFIPSPDSSFGQFTGAQDDLALHPAGYAVALNSATGKLQVLKLTAQVADASAPAATIYAGVGTRPGLLTDPVAVACSLDKILVLQQAYTDPAPGQPYGSVCAFDVKGNPVNCFAGGTSVTALRPEGTARVVVVDLSVESKGYLYVLKYLAPASGPVLASDYRLDIYNPDGTFLAQVAGLAAARLQVDLWRNLFTLNYEILTGSGRSEPSVAQWIPSTPPSAAWPGGSPG